MYFQTLAICHFRKVIEFCQLCHIVDVSYRSSPSGLAYLCFFVAPLSVFFVISFWRVRTFRLRPDFIFDNYVEAVGYYYSVLGFTFAIALSIAAAVTVLGFAFCFLIAAGDFVTPRMVGGPQTSMIGVFIQSQFSVRFNWPLGAAMSFMFLLSCLAALAVFRLLISLWRPR